jgi:hypothetical protein
MHPAEPGIETEEETQHWRILLRQLLTNCFPGDERAPLPVAYGFQSIFGSFKNELKRRLKLSGHSLLHE